MEKMLEFLNNQINEITKVRNAETNPVKCLELDASVRTIAGIANTIKKNKDHFYPEQVEKKPTKAN